ncbi:Uncharacterized protein dnm_048590 [Desulfonema magnum]|uniref:Uncharacterized protein n=1 Tax=Desulfonema magnum TaxID=45655 RepID=A0A975GPF8_9BACT|nr:Uncharacterized protein dnm_048590 [Desulfonema magnum]
MYQRIKFHASELTNHPLPEKRNHQKCAGIREPGCRTDALICKNQQCPESGYKLIFIKLIQIVKMLILRTGTRPGFCT